VIEDFHLQVQGERRGPYTLRQIDHMLNSGLIPSDALFLREGMEEWQPVTDLVAIRQPVSHWKSRAVLAGLALVLLLLARFFGPTVLEGWRETAQKEFTQRAAYWSAREAVRRQALAPGALVKFDRFSNSHVVLQPEPTAAVVQLAGEVIDKNGNPRKAFWEVALAYSATLKKWTSGGVKEQGK
jgi:hypothetical protein